MFGFTLQEVALVFCVPLAAFAVVSLIWRVDRRVEERRESALEAVAILKDYGSIWLTSIFQAYAIGNYSKLYKKFKEVLSIFFGDKTQLVVELEKIAERYLEKKSSTPEGRVYLRDKLRQYGFQPASTTEASNPA